MQGMQSSATTISPRAALSLPAGPVLDKFIDHYVIRDKSKRQAPPPYSTDLATALAKVERKMNSREWFLRIEFDYDIDEEPSVRAYFEHPDWDGFGEPADCAMLPEAICKSAICAASIDKLARWPFRAGDVVKLSSDPCRERKWTVDCCLEYLLEPHVLVRSRDSIRLAPAAELSIIQ